jgi:hypothetical protein
VGDAGGPGWATVSLSATAALVINPSVLPGTKKGVTA